MMQIWDKYLCGYCEDWYNAGATGNIDDYVYSKSGFAYHHVVDQGGNERADLTNNIILTYANSLRFGWYAAIKEERDKAQKEFENAQQAYQQAQVDRAAKQAEIDNIDKEIQALEERLSKIEAAIAIIATHREDILSSVKHKVNTSLSFIHTVVYLILLFELIMLMFVYYKRLIMLALLVIIFPLVAIAYGYERTTKPDSTILRNWMEEFFINVFVQLVHAIMYVTIVEAGYSVYLDSGENNWLLYFVAVLGLIVSEGVAKHVLGMQGNTVSALARYSGQAVGAVAAGVAVGKNLFNMKKDMKNMENSYQNREAAIRKKQAEHDRRTNTVRTGMSNLIRSNSHLSEAAKRRLLALGDKINGAVDKLTIKGRKIASTARRWKKTAGKVTRPLVNSMAAMGTVAAGFAAGGDMEDFVKAGAAARALTGGQDKAVELSEDAKKANEDNTKTENSVGNVTTQSAGGGSAGGSTESVPIPMDQSGSYDDYQVGEGQAGGYSGGSGDGGNYQSGNRPNPGNAQNAGNGATPPQPKPPTVTQQLFAQQLDETRRHYQEEINMHEQNK